MANRVLMDVSQRLLNSLLSVLLLAGCRAMTVLSNGEHSQSRRYWAGDTVYGAPGKPFQDRTEKNIVIFITDELWKPKEQRFRPPLPELKQESLQPIETPRSREVYHKHLKLEAGNVSSIYEWHGDTNVVIHLFECDPNALTADEVKASMRPLQPPAPSEVSLCLNPSSGLFEECSYR
jgi:hypothetical protein